MAKSPILAAAFAVAASLASPLQAQPAPAVTISCHNPNPGPTIASNQRNGRGRWRAATAHIQFNINRPADPGTVFVDGNNAGVCTMSVPAGYEITSGSWEFASHHPPGIRDSFVVDPSNPQRENMIFHVRATGLGVGNAGLTFLIQYRRRR